MRFTIATLVLIGGCLNATLSQAQKSVDLTFEILQPDGSPAAEAMFYQNRWGIADDMGMMGFGGMEEEFGMGGADDAGGGEMGMDYGFGGVPGSEMAPAPKETICFLNGRPVQEFSQPQGIQYESDSSGRLSTLDPNSLTGRKRKHRYASLAIHESGIHFIPNGTTFQKSIRLRKGGQIVVPAPQGIDPSKHIVLTCWQNGFAWPSLDSFEPSITYQFSNRETAQDWRFKPLFRLFQTGKLGEPITVPPGEVRITILPVQPGNQKNEGRSYEDMDGDELFDQLISGGPSRLIVVPGRSDQTTQVEFGPLVELAVSLVNPAHSPLPQWGDAPNLRYLLYHFESLQTQALQPGMAESLPRVFSSSVAFASFLNLNRSKRNAYQLVRGPVEVSPEHLSFPMLRPGRYVLGLESSNETATLWIPLTLTSRSGDRIQMKAGNGEPSMDLSRFVVNLNPAPAEQPKDAAAIAADSDRADAAKLKLVMGMRLELEQTVRRLIEHRRRLMNVENAIRARHAEKGGANVETDPFGGPATGDPFGDPFGGPANGSMNDPFSDNSLGQDPFGGSSDPFAPAATSPFGPPSAPGGSGAPFDDSSDPASKDPFG